MMKALLLVSMLFAGCTTPGESLSEARDGWFNISRGSALAGSDLYYCTAKEVVKPVCYKAEPRDPKRDSWDYPQDPAPDSPQGRLKEYQKTHPGAMFLPNDGK